MSWLTVGDYRKLGWVLRELARSRIGVTRKGLRDLGFARLLFRFGLVFYAPSWGCSGIALLEVWKLEENVCEMWSLRISLVDEPWEVIWCLDWLGCTLILMDCLIVWMRGTSTWGVAVWDVYLLSVWLHVSWACLRILWLLCSLMMMCGMCDS